MMTAYEHTQQVRAYYERNTRLFLSIGEDRTTQTIHRKVWAPGVATDQQALSYVNDLICQAIRAHPAPLPAQPLELLDLGCGVGGSLLHLAARLGGSIRGVGVSISPTQIRLATRQAARRGHRDRCLFLTGNFLQLPITHTIDAAWSIEALVHAPDPAAVLAEAARVLKPGARLMICDDFLLDRAGQAANAQCDLVVRSFRRGWHAAGLMSVAQLCEQADRAGLTLVEQRDLTPFLRLLRLPTPLVLALLQAGLKVPATWAFTQSLIGGLALQHGLAHGIFGYRWLAFERRAGSSI